MDFFVFCIFLTMLCEFIFTFFEAPLVAMATKILNKIVFFRKKNIMRYFNEHKFLLKFYERVKTLKQKSITLMHYYAVGGVI